MTYEKEMLKYRTRVTSKRGKRRGRRKTDVRPPTFLDAPLIFQAGGLLLLGALLLAACARTAI
jgi:hypothetical protein